MLLNYLLLIELQEEEFILQVVDHIIFYLIHHNKTVLTILQENLLFKGISIIHLREDDNEITIIKRLRTYEKMTTPLFDYYKK
tara:strand:- start:129 stop:377 length:249 start_codon:yes stop_codon:yes gene_type:complete